MKQNSRKIITILLICITVLSGCVPSSIMIQHSNSLSSIAYKNETMSEEDYTVMIKERGEYVPYLVITDNYDGSRNCLLLRKYLLDDYFRFNEDLEVSSYYKTCELGNYLDEEYIKIYSNELQDIIVNTDIEITSYLGLISCKNLKEHINRKVFLLSYNELCKDKSSSICAEGNAISYFEDKSHAVAVKANGEEGAYWLRTPDTWFTTVVCAIDTEGRYFSSGTSFGSDDYELGVRPAFCLPRNTQIIEEDGVYYIEADYNSPDLRENAEDRTEMLYEKISVPSLIDEVERVNWGYEPEGYGMYIKPALACQMEAHKEDPDYKFHTIIYSDSLTVWEEVIFDINNNPDNEVYLDMSYWVPKEVNDGFVRFYYILTAAEINALADMEINCAYVCTGMCDMDKANWDTPEGILEYCELYGDGYVKK